MPYFIGSSSLSDSYSLLWLVHYKLHDVSKDPFCTWNITRLLSCIVLQRTAKFISSKNVLYIAEWPTLTLMHKWVSFLLSIICYFLFVHSFNLLRKDSLGKSVLCAWCIEWLSLFYKTWTYLQIPLETKHTKGNFVCQPM